jgi:hypothetical protein
VAPQVKSFLQLLKKWNVEGEDEKVLKSVT